MGPGLGWAPQHKEWWTSRRVTDDIDLLWTLVSGVFLLMMAAGVGAVIEGFTRRRTVSTGAGRHVVTAAGAVAGVFAMSAFTPSLFEDAGDLWLQLGSAVLLATIVSGGIVERATFIAHGAVGAVVGAIVVPAIEWGQQPGGVLQSIAVSGFGFSDTAAATLFSVAGWMALVGVMVIGPRRGRLGHDGQLRSIPGKSMPAAAIGAVLVLATAVGATGRAAAEWSDMVIDSAGLIVLAGAVGALVALGIGWQRIGASSTSSMVQGALAGVVSSLGAPLELTVLRAIVIGAIGAFLASVAITAFERAKVDDPVGVISVFGVAGVWGTLSAATSSNAVVAQLVGALIIAAWSVGCAGAIFGVLRVLRVLRVSADIELVGLER